jgi:hypothetical protein
MRKTWFAGLLLLAACIPMQTKARFDQVGEYRGESKAAPITASPDAVKVFYGTSPPGFSLKDNELKVEPGFHHQILGTVKVVYESGSCGDGGLLSKADVIRLLRESAHAHGANAVIYAHSEPDETPSCESDDNVFGAGWAVVLSDDAPPAAPTPAAPSTPSATVSPAVPAP